MSDETSIFDELRAARRVGLLIRSEVDELRQQQREINQRLDNPRATDSEGDVLALLQRQMVLPYLIKIAELRERARANERHDQERAAAWARERAADRAVAGERDRARLAEIAALLDDPHADVLTPQEREQLARETAGLGNAAAGAWIGARAQKRANLEREREQIGARLEAAGAGR